MQFGHVRERIGSTIEGTLAIDVPSKQFFEHIFTTHSNCALFNAGLTIKSKNDHYVKKVGRHIASERMLPIKFIFNYISQDELKHKYVFYTHDLKIGRKSYYVEITLITIAESDKVNLITTFIDESYV